MRDDRKRKKGHKDSIIGRRNRYLAGIFENFDKIEFQCPHCGYIFIYNREKKGGDNKMGEEQSKITIEVEMPDPDTILYNGKTFKVVVVEEEGEGEKKEETPAEGESTPAAAPSGEGAEPAAETPEGTGGETPAVPEGETPAE